MFLMRRSIQKHGSTVPAKYTTPVLLESASAEWASSTKCWLKGACKVLGRQGAFTCMPDTASISAVGSRTVWVGHGIVLSDTNRGAIFRTLQRRSHTRLVLCGTSCDSGAQSTPHPL